VWSVRCGRRPRTGRLPGSEPLTRRGQARGREHFGAPAPLLPFCFPDLLPGRLRGCQLSVTVGTGLLPLQVPLKPKLVEPPDGTEPL
jgi:hypothetical protein